MAVLAAVPFEPRLTAPRLSDVVEALGLDVAYEGDLARGRVHAPVRINNPGKQLIHHRSQPEHAVPFQFPNLVLGHRWYTIFVSFWYSRSAKVQLGGQGRTTAMNVKSGLVAACLELRRSGHTKFRACDPKHSGQIADRCHR